MRDKYDIHLYAEPKKKKKDTNGLIYATETGFPGGLVVKTLSANSGDARDVGSSPGLGKLPGRGNDNPLQYSCLENSMDRACQPTAHGIAKSPVPLSNRALTDLGDKQRSWESVGLGAGRRVGLTLTHGHI